MRFMLTMMKTASLPAWTTRTKVEMPTNNARERTTRVKAMESAPNPAAWATSPMAIAMADTTASRTPERCCACPQVCPRRVCSPVYSPITT